VHRLGTSAPEPVHRLAHMFGMNIWLVSGHEEAKAVLADQRRFSNDIRPYVGAAGASVGGLGFTDPPEHTRLRRLLTPEFTMRRLERLRPRIVQLVEQQLDEVERQAQLPGSGDTVDLVQAFAFAVPFQVICELLGVPDEDRRTFRQLSAARFDVSYGAAGVFGAMTDACEFLMEVTRQQRADPGPGLIGQLIRDHGDEVTDLELNQLADGVFTGGFETSASMLALGTAVLLDHPGEYRRVGTDPSVVDRLVEELLRHLTVVQLAFPRFPRVELEVGGCRVAPGDVVVVHLAAANRDARTRPGVAGFDPDRAPGPHLAFGHGIHRCVGAELARMELRAAYPALARRFPDLSLAVSAEDLPYHAKSIVYGVESVPVRLYR
jgi:cytochrome P450